MTVLVTAASGKVGRQVVEELAGNGVNIRAGSRRSPVPLDWEDSATWPAALESAESVFLVVPGGDDAQRSVVGLGPRVGEFIDRAAATDVRHIVLMTALGMEFAPAEVEQRAVELHLGLPDGWTTNVGEGGSQLSGGERQRVSIARALLKNAPIVLLDEVTSALDPVNEVAVHEGIERLMADRTVVMVAHRLRTVRRADRIVFLDGGRVIEGGSHDELLRREGRYAQFWDMTSTGLVDIS